MKKRCPYYVIIFIATFLVYMAFPMTTFADDRPVLIVGDDEYFPPYSFLDDKGNPEGFNKELITAAADAVGYDVEFYFDEWSKVREALDKGEIDLIGGMAYSKERDESYSFSIKHSVAVRDIFTRKGEKVSKIKDLKGKTVVVQKADFFAEYLKNLNQEMDIRLIEVSSAREAIQLVSEGTYDYAAITKFPALYVINEFNYTNMEAKNISFPISDYGIAVLNENEDLLVKLNMGIYLIKMTGQYQEIFDKWITVYEEVRMTDIIKGYWWIPVIVGLLLIFLLAVATILRYLVYEKTKELEEANINIKLNADEIEANLEELTAVEEELRDNYEHLRISEEKRRSIIEALPDWVFTFSKEGKINEFHINEDSDLVAPKDQFIGKHISQVLPEEITNRVLPKIAKVFADGKLQSHQYELCKDDQLRNYELRLVKSDESEVLGIVRDITAEKRYQENTEYLSNHDYLTGLYNRHYFEKKLAELDNEENLPLGLIMADVNGLKLINDSFGHKIGDQLLIKVGEILKKACDSGEYVFRIGGDEFVILFPAKKSSKAEKLIRKIKDLAAKERINSIEISISFGWAMKKRASQDIHDIFRDSENQMYKSKLFEGPSIRGKTVNAIINTLYEKNKREEEHSRRVSELVSEFAEVLGLTEQEIQEIKTTGLLHDIGKIAIDESVLNKEGKLTKEEYEEIKLHPEIGYRILSSVNDMSDMADYVLSHHEKWDGTGYPRGIKGNEIPLQSRMIAIADAYDAMVSYRTYRLSKTKEEAIEELKKYAGTQFDPELVGIFIKLVLNE